MLVDVDVIDAFTASYPADAVGLELPCDLYSLFSFGLQRFLRNSYDTLRYVTACCLTLGRKGTVSLAELGW